MSPAAEDSPGLYRLQDDDLPSDLAERLSLCEALDRILNKGAVVAAEVVISVADVDLLYLQLRLLLTSVETLRSRPGVGNAP